ncbi:MAG: transporter, partial [Planctomycetota bacterium]
PGGRNLFLLEVPLQKTHYQGRGATSGFGDLRFRYFGLPYLNPAPRAYALGLSVDVFAPTGDVDKGLGLGDWVFAPGLLVGLRASDSVTVFPNFAYIFATGPTALAGSGGLDPLPPGVVPPSAEDTRGFLFEIQSLIRLPRKGYLNVNPTYLKTTSGADIEAFNIRLTYGVPLNPKTHITVSLLHEFANRDTGIKDQVRFGLARYF